MQFYEVPVSRVDPNEFKLSWWSIDKQNLRLSRAERLSNLQAITVNGATRSELKALDSWCKTNKVYKKFRAQTWTDSYSKDGFGIEFRNNETTVLADPLTMLNLIAWLDSLPKRTTAVLVEMDLGILRKTVRGTHARVITDMYDPRLHVVSVENGMLATELVLRSDG